MAIKLAPLTQTSSSTTPSAAWSIAKESQTLTVADSTPGPVTPDAPIVPKRPPKYQLGQTVVLKGYEDGWRWTVVDARLQRPKNPFWNYKLETVRPYDGKPLKSFWQEWKLRPVPVEG